MHRIHVFSFESLNADATDKIHTRHLSLNAYWFNWFNIRMHCFDLIRDNVIFISFYGHYLRRISLEFDEQYASFSFLWFYCSHFCYYHQSPHQPLQPVTAFTRIMNNLLAVGIENVVPHCTLKMHMTKFILEPAPSPNHSKIARTPEGATEKWITQNAYLFLSQSPIIMIPNVECAMHHAYNCVVK